MKKYICRNCGFQSLIYHGERCPGCGYLFSYLNHQPQWTPEALRAQGEEIPIRRLRCAFMKQDDQKDGMLMDCTITNKNLRLRVCGYYRDGRMLALNKLSIVPFDIVLPYRWMKKITRGMHMGRPARFFTYHHETLGPLNLWFFVDQGVEKKNPNIDAQVEQMVNAFLPIKENRYDDAVSV